MFEPQTVMKSWKSEGRAEGFAEGMALGMLEARRQAIARAVQLRFMTAVPFELAAALRQMTEPERLAKWFDAVLTAPTLEAFVMAVAQLEFGGSPNP
jgi:hypothetical protein